MKKYRISHLNYDFLARNRYLYTNTALYAFIEEGWEYGERYILASRKVFGIDKVELVKVVFKP